MHAHAMPRPRLNALSYLRRLKRIVLILPFASLLATEPVSEVYQKCLENSRDVYKARLLDCRTIGRNANRCRSEAAKEKRELLDYCAAGIKKQPAAIVINTN